MATENNDIGGRFIPARLREAREAKCLNMSQLAFAVDLTPASISQYEAGKKQPEWETMTRIANVLELPVSYFVNERPSGGNLESAIFFRSFKSKTKAVHQMLDQWRKWSGQLTIYAGGFVNLPPVLLPEYSDGTIFNDEEIEIIAQQCRRYFRLGDGPISNMVDLLESRGIIIVRAVIGTDNVDAFSCWQDGRPFIFLGNDKSSTSRSRFDAAHELGHILLHKHIIPDQIEDATVLERIEHEANRFASAFLLPTRTFLSEVFSASLRHFTELKRRWKVSIAAMIYRCKDLGVLDEFQYVNLRKQMSRENMLKKEPLDNEIPREESTLIKSSLELIIQNKIKSHWDFLSDLILHHKKLVALGVLPESVFNDDPRENIIIPLNLKVA
jgi:Zn-dependent peptidase ImmA (M78 family)/DNA-binding XRE family transcriptional regulator